MINIVFSIFTTMVFVIIITDKIHQTEATESCCQTKGDLACGIISSRKEQVNIADQFIHLKKNTILSEAKKALEECRDLVFTMAMIHTKVYASSNGQDSFDEYIKELTEN